MVSRYYRNRLESVLGTADEDSLAKVSNNWLTHSMLLDEVAKSVRKSGQKLDSEIEGEAGLAMVAKFNAISDKLELDSADMKKGSGALGLAQSAALEAIKTRNGIMLSGPMNQMPTKPEGPTPGTQATPEQETAMANYNSGVTQYLANEQMYEDNARKALEAMDKEYTTQTLVMKEIHGEPDPEEPSDRPGPD